MTPSVPVSVGFDLPPLAAGHRLHGVLAASLGAEVRPAGGLPWSAAFFGLDRVAVWRAAPDAVREAVRARCCAATLGEAVAIERAGLAFTARMVLLAETVDERLLYASFAGDEARHFAALRPWAPAAPASGPFLDLLAEVIETAARADLVVLVQVVLEGWGLVHYRALAEASADPGLAAVLRGILKDEARHHGGGLVLAQPLGPAGLRALAALLDLVRVGPVGVIADLEAELGPFDAAQRRRIAVELGAWTHARERLELLRGLLLRAGQAAAVAALEAGAHLSPDAPEAP